MQLGSVAAIFRYPVKALRAETLAATVVLADGLEGDRTSALVVTTKGHARSGQTFRGKEHPRLHTLRSSNDGIREAAAAGVGTTLTAGGRHFDVHPISLIFDTWLAELATMAGRDIEAVRFRPNLVATAAPGFAQREAELVGTRLRVGGVALTVIKPITRCVTPSYDLSSGERDMHIARALAVDRANIMGIYCQVATPGRIALGDAVLRV